MKSEKLFTENNLVIKGPLLIKNNFYEDKRGFFKESWNQSKFDEIVGSKIIFVQDNHSLSYEGVLRGMHYQTSPKEQAKLVRCTKGEIYDVLVDIRENSQTYLNWVGITLNEFKHEQLWVPEGFAHGFLTLSKVAEVQYKTNEYWSKENERSIKWDDPKIKIKWPINSKFVITSEKDKTSSFL